MRVFSWAVVAAFGLMVGFVACGGDEGGNKANETGGAGGTSGSGGGDAGSGGDKAKGGTGGDETGGTGGDETGGTGGDEPVETPVWDCHPNKLNNDICNCGCGAYDPDCDDPGAGIEGCTPGTLSCENVDGRSVCVGGFPWREDCGRISEPYCDCNCGAFDPDCADPGKTVYGCSPDTLSCQNGDGMAVCEGGVAWDCDDGWYNDGAICDCGCMGWDPDCDLAGVDVHGCLPGVSCMKVDGISVCDGTAWSPYGCDVEEYDDGKCDCRCGWEPDCEVDPTTEDCTKPGEVCIKGANGKSYCGIP